jgi:hypothetical protein
VPLHDQKINICCAIAAAWIVGPKFFENSINSDQYLSDILQSFLRALWKETRRYFMQDIAMTDAATYPINVVNRMFEDSHKSQIMACEVSRLRSLWFSSVGKSKR